MEQGFNRSTIVESQKDIVDVGFIQNDITQTRNNLLHEWQSNGRQIRAFEPEFDRVCYVTLNKYRHIAPQAYLEAKGQLDEYTANNLTTTVGERLNTSLSQWNYEIGDDGIYAAGTGEKAIEMFKRGRDFKRKFGKAVDFAREDAEVVGFGNMDQEVVNSTFIDPETGERNIDLPDGTMWVSFSHRGDVENGSMYPKNFYDTFTVKSKNGHKFIDARRFASALTPEQSLGKISKFDGKHYHNGITPNAEYFLSHPVRIDADNDAITSADALHSYLHKDIKDALSSSQFEFVLKRIKPAISAYLKGLAENPHNKDGQLEWLRSVLNAADSTRDILTGKSGGGNVLLEEMVPLTYYELEQYKQQEVEVFVGGCGATGEYGGGKETIFGFEKTSAYSVAEFGKKKWEYHKGNCRVCKKEDLEVGPCKICKACEKKFDE